MKWKFQLIYLICMLYCVDKHHFLSNYSEDCHVQLAVRYYILLMIGILLRDVQHIYIIKGISKVSDVFPKCQTHGVWNTNCFVADFDFKSNW